MPKHILELWWLIAVVLHKTLSCFGVELSRCVPHCCALLGRFVSLAFRGVQVQQFRSFHIFKLVQHPYHFLDIVPVEWAEVAYVHTLEEVLLLGKSRLDGVVQANNALASLVVQYAFGVQPLRCLETKSVVSFVGIEVEQVLLHTANGSVYRHIVVVQDDEQVVGLARSIVQTLESQATAHCAVADNGYYVAFGVVCHLGSYCHS